MSVRVIRLLSLPALMAGACTGDAGRPSTDVVTVRDSAGVRIVDNARPVAANTCIVIAKRPRVTIPPIRGVEEGVPAVYQVWGGTVLGDGKIVLLNAGTRQLLFFSEAGRYVSASGREGRGPGEFVRPSWLTRGMGDTLFVWDNRERRLSLFDSEGEFLSSRRVPGRLPSVRGRFEDGSFLVTPISLVQISGDGSVERDPLEYLRYDPQNDSMNHLADGLGQEWVDGAGGPYALPFGKDEFSVANGDMFVVGDSRVPVLRYYDLQGRLQRVVEWVSPAIAVTATDRANYRKEYAADGRSESRPREAKQFAEVRPRFSAIETDRAGWLWVKGFTPAWEAPEEWLVFDEGGELRCRVEMPIRLSVLEIGEDYILGRQTGNLGEETVVLYDVNRLQ